MLYRHSYNNCCHVFMQLADAMELMLLSILSPAVKCQWGLSSGEEAAITSVFVFMYLFSYPVCVNDYVMLPLKLLKVV